MKTNLVSAVSEVKNIYNETSKTLGQMEDELYAEPTIDVFYSKSTGLISTSAEKVISNMSTLREFEFFLKIQIPWVVSCKVNQSQFEYLQEKYTDRWNIN